MSPFALVSLRRTLVIALTFFLLPAALNDSANLTVLAAPPPNQIHVSLAGLLLSFEPNLGQTDPRVKFISRGPGYTLFLAKNEAVLAMQESGARSQKSGQERRPLSVARSPSLSERNSKFKIQDSTARLAPNSNTAPPSVLRLRLLGASVRAKVAGLDELPGKSNYFIGKDPKKWHTHVPTYSRVRYQSVYPGVDLVYYGKGGQLEYDFVVAPRADPSAIRLAIASTRQPGSGQKAEGKTSLRIAPNGDLIVTQAGCGLRFHKPIVYQEHLGAHSGPSIVESKAQLLWTAQNTQLAPISQRAWSRPEGRGFSPAELAAPNSLFYPEPRAAPRPRGCAGPGTEERLEGSCRGGAKAPPFPRPGGEFGGTTDHGQRGPANPKSNIQNRIYVDARYVLKPDGVVTFEIAPYDTALPLIIDPVLSYSTYLGGSDMDYANAIAVDSSGNAYVTGYTASVDFPVVNPVQGTPGGGTCSEDGTATPCFDAFVSKLNSTGTALVYSTYLGGSDEDYGASVAVDSSGDTYVAGYTYSTNFPVQNALQPNNAGGVDAFVTELSPDGASLIYSTYWGGSLDDVGTGIAVDSNGNAYLSGYTESTDFPVTSGAFQTVYGDGAHNGFVVKFNSGGAQVGYSTYLGGSGDDYAYAAAVDSAGDAYVTGATNSTNFPTLNALQPNYAGGQCAVAPNTFPCFDAFISKLNPAGSALLFSTYLGGTGSDYGYAIALDSSHDAYITGYTTSQNFPITSGAFQSVFGGSYDVFVAKLNSSGSALGYSTYLGGSGTQVAYGIAVDSNGAAYVTGYNYGGNFPTANPVQAQNAAFYDAFVSVLDPTGSFLLFSTYLGGSQDDFGRGIALDPSANVYVAGATFSPDFPITSNAFQPSYGGGPYDAFVTAYNAPAVPVVAISPASYQFANQAVGTSSSPEPISLSNNGYVALTISSLTISGDFSQTNNCDSGLAPGASCTISVTFTPSGTGSLSGSIIISDNASPPTQTIYLTGTGAGAGASLSPSSLTFSSQAVGTSSSPQTLTLSNTGSAALTISSIAVTSDFSQTNTCGASLAANASCTISVTFTPTATGSRTGSLTISDNANPSTQTVSLSGTGTAPAASLSSTSLTFSSQALGTSSSLQSVILSNTGNAVLTISSIVVSGSFSQTNTCGSSLASAASCTISVTFTPTATGTLTGTLTITDNANPATQSVSLTGTGTAPAASLSPTSLTFASQAEGSKSTPQNLTLTNTGSATLTISSITISGQFSQTNTCGSSLASSNSCTISVTFAPTTTGTLMGTVTVTDNASPATQSASLTGTGALAPAVSLSSTSLTFVSQALGTTSSAQSVTLKNSGKGTLTISSISASGDFSQTNTCGSSVAPSASCALKVSFKPTATGTRTGTLTLTDNACPSTQTVTLTGTGTGAVVSLSPTSLTFGSQTVGSSSSPQKVSLKNTGNVILTITGFKISGDFSQTNTCGLSVAVNAACTISVTFKPVLSGTLTGTLTISDNAAPTTQTVSLTGTGAPATSVKITPASLTFSAQTVGTTSTAQTVILSNTGSATLVIDGVAASGDASQTNDCGSSVPVNASCNLSVTFNPSAGGTRTGAVSITDTAAGSPQAVTLTGTGEDFLIAASSTSFASATVSPGGTATYSLSVLALGGFNQNVALNCTGAPSESGCAVSPSLVNFSSPSNVTVTVVTATPSFSLPRHIPLPPLPPTQPRFWLLWTMALLALRSLAHAFRRRGKTRLYLWAGRSRMAFATFGTLLLLMLALTACGGGGGGGEAPPAASSGTPAGTYTLTVTGTCSSCSVNLSHSLNLTLTVQ